ncbi:MAG TPA: ABC transporter ATP-binding protein, partial [Fibrobacteria bacterium]|nr:ABC transporter ATP-binding protein [Fibrobacteria bacterium]
GCGKSTLLRLIAGLERPDAGSIRIGERDVTGEPPHLRGCAMVFQSYALWPHLTVGENITYGLEVRKRPKAEVRGALDAALSAYHLEGLGPRFPHQLSGGQQQRVALARAMAVAPQAVLMDEPFSNLDAALRKSLRRELLDFHHRSGNTIVHVTHDQEEALALSDRIALLQGGRVAEIGEPRALYARPARLATALFLGDMNALRGGRLAEGQVTFGERIFPVTHASGEGPGTLCVRPERTRVLRPGAAGKAGPEATGPAPGRLPGVLRFTEFQGTHRTLGVETPLGDMLARLPVEEEAPQPGEAVDLELPPEHCLWYPEGAP